SDFAYLTGLGGDHEPGAVLVMEPREIPPSRPGAPTTHAHDATLYVTPPAGRDDEGVYADPRSGEFWIGRRPGPAEFEAMTGIPTKPREDLPGGITLSRQPLKAVQRELSMMRMVKDEYEIQQMRDAVAATVAGFERV